MRGYLATTADELAEFLESGSLDIPEVYVVTPIYKATHPEMDEEEQEYSLSLLAAEEARGFIDHQSGAAIVLALELSEEVLGVFDEFTADLTSSLQWSAIDAVFVVGEDIEDLTWYASQEVESNIDEWLK